MRIDKFLEELVDKMNQYGLLEHDVGFRIDAVHVDGSVDVLAKGEEWGSRFVLAYAGEFDSGEGIHQMIMIREETPIVMNAVPKFIVAAVLEI